MNRAHKLNRVIICGASGTGKTTLYAERILASKARWKFVYDPEEEFSEITGMPVAKTVEEMQAHLAARGIVVFNPEQLFSQGDDELGEGFVFFCRWVFEVSERLPGLKLLAADEIQDFTPNNSNQLLPRSIKRVMDKSRKRKLDSIFNTNAPNELHPGLRRQVTEIVSFKQVDVLPVDWLEERGFDRAELEALPPRGGYVVRNSMTGEMKKGETRNAPHVPRKRDPLPSVPVAEA
ncbi:MAG: hypothetical protein L0Z53_21545 [Acidobacteriales bacterium]|nr:hypothetical protein [Terriglobales bacterium]